MGAEVNKLKAAGGLTRRELACQIKADVTGKEVILVEELENTALGCMIITRSTAEGKSMHALADEVVDYGKRFEPDPEVHDRYCKLYQLFRKLYQENKDNVRRRANLICELGTDTQSGDKQL